MDLTGLSDDQLISKYEAAAARAAFSNSGMVISAFADSDREGMIFLRQEVLRRLKERAAKRSGAGDVI